MCGQSLFYSSWLCGEFPSPPFVRFRPSVLISRPLPSAPPYSLSPLRSGRRGVVVSGVRRMNEVNEVNARRARLVPGWVTVFGRVYHLSI